MNKRGKNAKGQVWVETVIYTLIAMVMIGLVLAFVQPKIIELSDRATLQQSISMLNEIHSKVLLVAQSSPGNVREVKLNLRQGVITIDGNNGRIIFNMDKSHFQLSEPDTEVGYGDIIVYTHPFNDLYSINMTIDYSEYDITYNGEDAIGTINPSTTPYSLLISNNGGEPIKINFELQ